MPEKTEKSNELAENVRFLIFEKDLMALNDFLKSRCESVKWKYRARFGFSDKPVDLSNLPSYFGLDVQTLIAEGKVDSESVTLELMDEPIFQKPTVRITTTPGFKDGNGFRRELLGLIEAFAPWWIGIRVREFVFFCIPLYPVLATAIALAYTLFWAQSANVFGVALAATFFALWVPLGWFCIWARTFFPATRFAIKLGMRKYETEETVRHLLITGVAVGTVAGILSSAIIAVPSLTVPRLKANDPKSEPAKAEQVQAGNALIRARLFNQRLKQPTG